MRGRLAQVDLSRQFVWMSSLVSAPRRSRAWLSRRACPFSIAAAKNASILQTKQERREVREHKSQARILERGAPSLTETRRPFYDTVADAGARGTRCAAPPLLLSVLSSGVPVSCRTSYLPNVFHPSPPSFRPPGEPEKDKTSFSEVCGRATSPGLGNGFDPSSRATSIPPTPPHSGIHILLHPLNNGSRRRSPLEKSKEPSHGFPKF